MKTILATMLIMMLAASTQAQELRQTPHELRREISRTVVLDYLLYLPPAYQDGSDEWPLLLFLHGAGERGSDLELVKVHGPPKLIEQGHDFPFLVVSPQGPAGVRWDPTELAALIDEIVERYRVDESRIYLTGLSMGGFGTWALAMEQPERFAAIAPICGGGETLGICSLRNTPTWVFHGALDQVVPLERSTTMVEALERCGGDVRLTVYPEAGHDSWTETYDNPELYEWLLSHRRER